MINTLKEAIELIPFVIGGVAAGTLFGLVVKFIVWMTTGGSPWI